MGLDVNNVPDIWDPDSTGIHYNDGFVTIGNTDGVAPLDVTSQTGGQMCSFRFYYNDGSGAVFRCYKARGSLADPRRSRSGDTLGGVNAFGFYAADDSTTATQGTVSGQFQFYTAEAYTSTARGARFKISLMPAGSVAALVQCLTMWHDGTNTHLQLNTLPTSSVGLSTGELWIDTGAGNVLKVV